MAKSLNHVVSELMHLKQKKCWSAADLA